MKAWVKGSSPRKEVSRAYYLANRERIKARVSQYRLDHHDKVVESKKDYYQRNRAEVLGKNRGYKWARKSASGKRYYASRRELIRAQHRLYYSTTRDLHLARLKLRRARFPEAFRVKDARRRAAQKKALPKWTTLWMHRQMREIYRNTPGGYHVDHIVPLCGKTVCGLHVPWNLQYLTADENRRKANRW